MFNPTISYISMAVTLAMSSVAFANEQGTEEANIEKISVLGQRLEYNTSATGLMLSVQQTPQSISVIDAQAIQDFALDNVADVVGMAAGINVQKAETSRFFFSARGNPVTNFQYDGLPVFYNSFFSEAVSDSILFERVEVVRGATGLLSGAGEPSAAINLIRKKAGFEQQGYVTAKVGSWQNVRLEGDFNTPLNSDGSIRGRVAASIDQGESHVDLAEKDNLQLYTTVGFDLGANTEMNIGIEHAKRRPKGSTWGALPLFYADGSSADDLAISSTTAANWTYWDRDNTSAFVNLAHSFTNGWQLRAEYERRDDKMDGKLLYLSGHPDRDTGLGMSGSSMIYQSDRTLDSARIYADGPFELFSREHRLIVGANLSDQHVTSDSFYAISGDPVGNFLQWDGSVSEPTYADTAITGKNNEQQVGAYIATQLSVTDKLTLVLGNRFSRYDYENEVDSADNYKQTGINTPYAGLVFSPVPTVSIYTSYTEIFQPQNAKDKNDQRLDPVEGSNLEAGVKSTWLDERLLVTAAVFKVEKDNVAVLDPSFTEPLPDGSFPYIGKKGTQSKGFEVEISGQVTDSFNANFSYAHTKSEDENGDDFATHNPEHLVKLSGMYDYNEAFKFGVNAHWQNEIYNENVGPNNAHRAEQASYWLVNMMARYKFTEQFSGQMNINNVFDKKYYSSIDFYNQGFFGAPRNIEASVRYQF